MHWHVGSPRTGHTQLTELHTHRRMLPGGDIQARTHPNTHTHTQKHVHSPRDTPTPTLPMRPLPCPELWVSEMPAPGGLDAPPAAPELELVSFFQAHLLQGMNPKGGSPPSKTPAPGLV